MVFDSLATAALAAELRELVGGRVQRIVQAGDLELGLEIFARGQRHALVLSADPVRSGLWLAEEKIGKADAAASPIVLLMRKYLRGARLDAVEQPELERILLLHFVRSEGDESEDAEAEDRRGGESGERAGVRRSTVIVEAMGRLGNVILIDDRGVILDSLKRVPPSINRHRTILPRKPYVGPPEQTKASPLTISADVLDPILGSSEGTAAAALVASFRGISTLAAREIVKRASGRIDTPAREADAAALVRSVDDLFAPLRGVPAARWEPSVAYRDGAAVAFAPYRLTHADDFRPTRSISDAIVRAAGDAVRLSPLDQLKQQTRASVEARRARESRRLASLEREMAAADGVDALREAGELLLAFGSMVEPGSSSATIEGRTITLDADLTPVENAQRYFDRYARARDARKQLPPMIEQARQQLAFLAEALVNIDLAESRESVEAIRAEIADEAPAPPGPKAQPRRHKVDATARRERDPLTVRIAGHVVYVGRSAKENDAATFKLALPGDLWLHARGVAGAHVVVRREGASLPQAVLERAAAIAAYHSEARTARRVPVDVTERRHVRKIKGAPPGAVTYSDERTVMVEPRPPGEVGAIV